MTSSTRIHGIDMARGLAMAGMTVVHFVAFWEGEGALFTAASLFDGRAMPLFMLLGGLSVTLMAQRASTPDRNLLIRAAMLLALGLFLTEFVERLAIVLQAYAAFFVLAVGLRRLPSRALLALVPAVMVVGSVTIQVVGEAPQITEFGPLFTSLEGLESLVFDGFYSLFPVGAFFIFGIWLGRQNLRATSTAVSLAGFGTVVGVTTWVASGPLIDALGLEFVGGRTGNGTLQWARLLDVQGHSGMLGWTISALGTSSAVVGFSLLVGSLVPRVVSPLAAVGSLSLTYYVFQALMTNLVPDTPLTSVEREWLYVVGIYLTFAAVAVAWRNTLGAGPLERVLRLGSGPRRATPPAPNATRDGASVLS